MCIRDSLLLVAAMTVGLVACGSSSGDGKKSSASSDEKILSVQTGPDPETVDPALNSAIDGGEMILHAFEGLLKLDENGDPEAGPVSYTHLSEVAGQYFDQTMLMQLLEDHRDGKADNSRKIWAIYGFLVWYEIYIAADEVQIPA